MCMRKGFFIERELTERLQSRLFKGKAVILYGPRQSGKTTLIKKVLERSGRSFILLNADEPDVRAMLTHPTSVKLGNVIGKHEVCCIDEAQRVPDIGLTLKLITDEIPAVQTVATGSSSLELNSSVAEPLTGRKYEFTLYPLSFGELKNHHGLLTEKRSLEHRLVYGSYPEIVTTPGEEQELVKLLADSYLFKDLLALNGIKKPALLEKIVRALALQLGSEVSFHEIAQLTGASTHTIERYISLLEKTYVVFQLPAFSRNVRNEIRKGKKIYFWDNGIRNAVIGNFQPAAGRTDAGALWENYLVCERAKMLNNAGVNAGMFFWRTTQQQEIDYIEEQGRQLKAVEFKWNPARKKVAFPKTFEKAYPEAVASIVATDNFEQFLMRGGTETEKGS